jgi:hypothetical protein
MYFAEESIKKMAAGYAAILGARVSTSAANF